MELDALIIQFALPSNASLAAVTAGLYRGLEKSGVQFDPWRHDCGRGDRQTCPRCVPLDISAALEAARIRARQTRLLDRLWPRLKDRSWLPVAQWLSDVGDLLAGVRGGWGDAVGLVPGGVVGRTSGGVGFVFSLLAGKRKAPVVLLLVDWLTFNRCQDGPREVSRVVANIGSGVGSLISAGGTPEFWQINGKGCLSHPFESGAMIVGSPSKIPEMSEHTAQVGHFRVGWRPPAEPISEPANLRGEEVDEQSAFAPTWTGCSGVFVPRSDGQDEASLHYEKHVRTQREWSTGEMPDLAKYVEFATSALDAMEHAYEMWQPSNHAIVKYDPGRDVLAIGNLHDGDIRTCFRPGGGDYVLRKLRAGHWVPPPVRGAVAYEAVRDDDELETLFGECERAVAETEAEACAAAAHDAGQILSAIASHERVEFLLWRIRSQYLTTRDEVRLDAIGIAVGRSNATLDVALEIWPPDVQASAIATAVDRYISESPDALVAENPEDLDELLGLRDRIELARMAARARGRLAGMVPPGVFRDTELAAVDALIMACRRSTVDSVSVGVWPETFVWRLQNRR